MDDPAAASHPAPPGARLAPTHPVWHGLLRRLSLSVTLTLLAVLTGPGRAGEPDTDEARELLTLLGNQTELATKTGMNADFIPGMVTILSGSDMLTRGARTVWEAVSLVPGISPGIEATGERLLLSRGVGHGYASGNIKILLDGMSMNSTLSATANPVLNLPIEQVERIEVIRGPGSSVYGEYAYAGVVNVITRRRERTLHLQGAQEAGYGGGGVWYWEEPNLGLTSSINLVGVKGNGGVQVSEDALFAIGRPELSNAPGPSNEAKRYGALVANVQWRDTFASLSVLDDAHGDHFGINHFLPPSDDHLAARQRYLTAQIGQDWRLSETLSARARIEGMEHQRNRDGLYVFPQDYFGDQPIIMDQGYQETAMLAAADLHWQPLPRHQLLFGLEAKQVEVDEAPWAFQGFIHPLPPTWMDTDTRRRVLSALVQDEFRVGERLSLTATLRYDDYDDVGAYASPRAAAVWRIDDQNIVKFQYAQAFRPPTFYELTYPDPDGIDVSQIATYELGFILKRPAWEARFILFHSDLTGPIVFDELGVGGYTNSPDTTLDGAELEYQHRFGSRIKVDANLSYVDARRQATDDPLPGGPSLLGNLALLWQATDRWTAALQLRYIGPRDRDTRDERLPANGQTQANLTLNWRALHPGLQVHLGVKNLLNAEIRYPSQFQQFDGVELPYLQDYPRPERRLWLSVGYSF